MGVPRSLWEVVAWCSIPIFAVPTCSVRLIEPTPTVAGQVRCNISFFTIAGRFSGGRCNISFFAVPTCSVWCSTVVLVGSTIRRFTTVATTCTHIGARSRSRSRSTVATTCASKPTILLSLQIKCLTLRLRDCSGSSASWDHSGRLVALICTVHIRVYGITEVPTSTLARSALCLGAVIYRPTSRRVLRYATFISALRNIRV